MRAAAMISSRWSSNQSANWRFDSSESGEIARPSRNRTVADMRSLSIVSSGLATIRTAVKSAAETSQLLTGGVTETISRLQGKANGGLIRSGDRGQLAKQVRRRLELQRPRPTAAGEFAGQLGLNRAIVGHGRGHEQHIMLRPVRGEQALQIVGALEPPCGHLRTTGCGQ